MKKPIYRRIVLKLSGEALEGDRGFGIDPKIIASIAHQIKDIRDLGVDVVCIIGGGNFFRGVEGERSGIDRATADYIGMLGSVQNSRVLRDYFESQYVDGRASSAIGMRRVCSEMMQDEVEKHLSKGRIVIFAAGLGAAYFSTDSNAVQRALEIGAEMLVMAKNGVDGIYSADPRTDPNAKKIDRITCAEVLAKELKVADASAIALARENKLPIKIVAMDAITSVFDDTVGSVIDPL